MPSTRAAAEGITRALVQFSGPGRWFAISATVSGWSVNLLQGFATFGTYSGYDSR
ncbi:MAG: hypothetical protein WB579_11740 [Bryobacteraceae bacterium]